MFGGELTVVGYLDRPSGRANAKKSADDRQGICLVHQAIGARGQLTYHLQSLAIIPLERRSKPHFLHSAMRRYALSFVPSHEEPRFLERTTFLVPSTPTTCMLTSR
jgi:hypothetical protein